MMQLHKKVWRFRWVARKGLLTVCAGWIGNCLTCCDCHAASFLKVNYAKKVAGKECLEMFWN